MKTQKGFTAVEGLLILVIIGIVGFTGWYVWHRHNSQPRTINDVLSSISSDSKNAYSNAAFEPKYDWGAEAEATVPNKVPGYQYSISGFGEGIWLPFESSNQHVTVKKFIFFKKTLPDAVTIDVVKNYVGKRLIKYGFTTTDNVKYRRGSSTCTVSNDRLSLFANISHLPDENSNLLDVSCFGDEVLMDGAAQMKPFVDEYLKQGFELNGSKMKASDLTVGPLTIKSKNGSGVIGSSHAAGYDIAEMVVATNLENQAKQIALFYSKNNVWHFVTQANDEYGFECGPMKANPDARKALYDQVCLSEKGQVRLDTNNRALLISDFSSLSSP